MQTQIKEDWISPLLVERMGATLGQVAPQAGEVLPHLWHWMFFQPALMAGELGHDGHPATTEFLPDAVGRNRMWAGGRFEFERSLVVGQLAQCVSVIENIVEKQGKTGALLFVTVRHEYTQNHQHCFTEWQDIVYREPTAPKHTSDVAPKGDWHIEHCPDATQLFRYSAVTFNGHRIHYDYPYATKVEGYANLVVHGPMMATWALHGFMQTHREYQVKRFTFRGIRPTTLPEKVYAGGRLLANEEAEVWIANEKGIIQQGKVEFIA